MDRLWGVLPENYSSTHIWLCYNLPGVHLGIWHTPLESQNCVPPVTSLHEIISCLDSEPSIRVPSGQANVTDCPGVYSVPWWWQFLTHTPEITVCQTTLYQKTIKFKQIKLTVWAHGEVWMTVPIWVTLLLTVWKRRGWILFNKTCQACIKLPMTNDFQCLCLVWFPWIVAQTLLAFQCQHCSNGMLCLVTLMKRIVILDETAIT